MKLWIATLFLLAMPLNADAGTSTETAKHTQQIVHADQLKSWYEQKRPMVVVDARSKPYFDGNLLPQAKWLPLGTSDQEILAALPNKDQMIVVYCANSHCPASGMLGEKLADLGYKNVYEYPEGISDWVEKGYPTTK